MRQSDQDELAALSGHSPLEAVALSTVHTWEKKGEVIVVEIDGEAAAVCGHHPGTHVGEGIVWMLGTDKLTADPKLFMRHSLHAWRAIRERYKAVGNVIWIGSTEHIAWLKALGCEFTPHTSNSLLFSCVNP